MGEGKDSLIPGRSEYVQGGDVNRSILPTSLHVNTLEIVISFDTGGGVGVIFYL